MKIALLTISVLALTFSDSLAQWSARPMTNGRYTLAGTGADNVAIFAGGYCNQWSYKE